jgi:hypothetical protein
VSTLQAVRVFHLARADCVRWCWALTSMKRVEAVVNVFCAVSPKSGPSEKVVDGKCRNRTALSVRGFLSETCAHVLRSAGLAENMLQLKANKMHFIC